MTPKTILKGSGEFVMVLSEIVIRMVLSDLPDWDLRNPLEITDTMGECRGGPEPVAGRAGRARVV